MSNKTFYLSSALLALGLADNLSNKARSARRDARDALYLSEDNADTITMLVDSPDRARLAQPSVRDVILGLGYPRALSTPAHSDFPSNPIGIERPIFAEPEALSAAYPPRVNQYDGDGKLVNPTEAYLGQMFDTGRALTFAESKAMLLGGTLNEHPTEDTQKQIFRHYRALVEVLEEMVASSTVSLEDVKQVWRDFYGRRGGTGAVFWRSAAGGSSFSATAETKMVGLPLPKNSLKPGEAAVYHLGIGEFTVDGTDTYTIRLRKGDVGGTLLGSAGMIPIGNDTGEYIVTIMRREDVGGQAQFTVSLRMSFGAGSTTSAVGIAPFTWDHTEDQELFVGHLFGGAGNTGRFQYGYGEKK